MDNSILDFFAGKTNVLPLNAVLVREKSPGGSQYITIYGENGEQRIYSFWHNPKKPVGADTDKPKNTGGKKPYLMVMTQEIERLRKLGVSGLGDMLGFLLLLGDSIEWNTGRLIDKRTKEPLKYKDLGKIAQCGNRKLNGLLKALKEHDLLKQTDEGYFISSRLIKKGKTKKVEGD